MSRQTFWWIDIFGKTIHRYDPATGEQRSYPTPEEPGSLRSRRRRAGAFHDQRIFFFDPESGQFDPIVD